MKIKLLIFFIFCSTMGNHLLAQDAPLYEKNFPSYSEYVAKQFGITCKIPGEFKDLNKFFLIWKVREDPLKYAGDFYGPIFLSRDKNCMMMYAAMQSYNPAKEINMPRVEGYPRSQIEFEIRTALGLCDNIGRPSKNDSSKWNFNDYVTTIGGKKVHKMFNADSVYIYEIPGADSVFIGDKLLEKERKARYPHCTGLYITKKDRFSMGLKFFFTAEGKKNEQKYIDMLTRKIWYDDKFKHELN